MQQSHTTNGGEGRLGAPRQSAVNISKDPVIFAHTDAGMFPDIWLLCIVACSVVGRCRETAKTLKSEFCTFEIKNLSW